MEHLHVDVALWKILDNDRCVPLSVCLSVCLTVVACLYVCLSVCRSLRISIQLIKIRLNEAVYFEFSDGPVGYFHRTENILGQRSSIRL